MDYEIEGKSIELEANILGEEIQIHKDKHHMFSLINRYRILALDMCFI